MKEKFYYIFTLRVDRVSDELITNENNEFYRGILANAIRLKYHGTRDYVLRIDDISLYHYMKDGVKKSELQCRFSKSTRIFKR